MSDAVNAADKVIELLANGSEQELKTSRFAQAVPHGMSGDQLVNWQGPDEGMSFRYHLAMANEWLIDPIDLLIKVRYLYGGQRAEGGKELFLDGVTIEVITNSFPKVGWSTRIVATFPEHGNQFAGGVWGLVGDLDITSTELHVITDNHIHATMTVKGDGSGVWS